MRPTLALIGILLLTVPRPTRADGSAYALERRIHVQTSDTTCTHWHDWSRKTRRERYAMMTGDQNPFGSDNNYAYVECVSKRSAKPAFKSPSPALTHLWISSDQRYVVGLSNIQASNPYQLVVFRMNGQLVYAMHVTSEEACFERDEFASFYREHPDIRTLLQERTTLRDGRFFVDFSLVGPSRFGDEAWSVLAARICRSHLSPNIVESVSNWVRWFRESDPGIVLDRDVHGEATGLTLIDPAGDPMKVLFNEARR